MTRVGVVTDLVQNPPRGLFWTTVVSAEIAIVVRDAWRTDADPQALVDADSYQPVLVNWAPGDIGAFGTWKGVPLYCYIDNGSVEVMAATDDPAVFEELRACLPPAEAADLEVPFTFWVFTPRGPESMMRRLEVPRWNDIDGNYSGEARTDLAALMDESFAPGLGGKLVIWHGEPGTGKTFAIRALSWQWREWCDFHYVADPEEFFGQAQYLFSVLLAQSNGGPIRRRNGAATPEAPRPRWRCLVLEDTGELLAADAKDKTGQGLSRLLNVVDGLIGQALNVLVLVTTNDELGRLHPAVLRPGRCAMKTYFGKLSREEVEEWRRRRGVPDPGSGEAFLSELFAETESFYNRREPRAVGFGPPRRERAEV